MDSSSVRTYHDIHGWFQRMDVRLFRAFLTDQADTPPGDLVEIGVFKGKSAVVIGEHLRQGERFVVIDIFNDLSLLDDSGSGQANAEEQQHYYPRLTRETFEENYLAIHPELPVVVQAPSGRIVEHVEPGAARFMHVDASHLYAGVAEDCRSAQKLLRPGGVVAFDDWRNQKCPGVGAAVWEAVVRDGLIPVAVTPNKFYGVYSGAQHAREVVRAELASEPDWWRHDEHEIFGHTVLRLFNQDAMRRRAESKQAKETDRAAPEGDPGRSVKSWVGHELLPPALLRRLQARRAR